MGREMAALGLNSFHMLLSMLYSALFCLELLASACFNFY